MGFLRSYYADHRGLPQRAGRHAFPSRRRRKKFSGDYYSFEMTKRSCHRPLRLKEEIQNCHSDDDLKRLPIEDEFDPKAIDIYGVKKGGRFPAGVSFD